MKNRALFAFLWQKSKLNFRRLLGVLFSPSVTEGVKKSNLICHFYKHCQPSLCRLHTTLKRPLLPKHFFISQFEGSFQLKTKDREFKMKVRFAYNS